MISSFVFGTGKVEIMLIFLFAIKSSLLPCLSAGAASSISSSSAFVRVILLNLSESNCIEETLLLVVNSYPQSHFKVRGGTCLPHLGHTEPIASFFFWSTIVCLASSSFANSLFRFWRILLIYI